MCWRTMVWRRSTCCSVSTRLVLKQAGLSLGRPPLSRPGRPPFKTDSDGLGKLGNSWPFARRTASWSSIRTASWCRRRPSHGTPQQKAMGFFCSMTARPCSTYLSSVATAHVVGSGPQGLSDSARQQGSNSLAKENTLSRNRISIERGIHSLACGVEPARPAGHGRPGNTPGA